LQKEVDNHNAIEEAKRIIHLAEKNGVILRLIGGLAARLHCHGPHSEHLRSYHDIDIFGLSNEYKRIIYVFQELGYFPNRRYNVLYGAKRLQFIDQASGKNVDIFLDQFQMQHTLDFRARLHLDSLTIPITDLLLTKLQNFRLALKDEIDIIAILEDHDLGDINSQEILNVTYISNLCSRDWGLYKTITVNLRKMSSQINEGLLSLMNQEELINKLETIHTNIQMGTKTFRWKLRSLLGGKVRWYKEVELGEGELY